LSDATGSRYNNKIGHFYFFLTKLKYKAEGK